MKIRLVGTLAVALCAFGAAWMLPTPAAAQAGKNKTSYKAPRWDDGKTANLQGIWIVDAWDTSRYGLEWHNAATGIRPGKGSIIDPADGMIPYTPAARAIQQRNLKNQVLEDPMRKCYMLGVPRFVTSGFPFQIIQTKGDIILASEYVHMIRYVRMGRTQNQYEDLDLWNGDSVGKWEGDTLVVTTKANGPQTWFDMMGNHHSAKLVVVERFTRTGENTMAYTATMTDPETLTKPFTVSLTLHRNTDKNAQLMEYECHAYAEEDPKH